MSQFIFYYAECHWAECRYAECHYAECHYAECHYAQCHYAECRYTECRYAACRSTSKVCVLFSCIVSPVGGLSSAQVGLKYDNSLTNYHTEIFLWCVVAAEFEPIISGCLS